MLHTIVAMMCGPHENCEPSFRRIDVAVESAALRNAPLLIVGDGNHGEDTKLFARHAREEGIPYVYSCYDAHASTYADAIMIAQQLLLPDFATVAEIVLVTDHWHMNRAGLFLNRALYAHHPHRPIRITQLNVPTPMPPQEVLDGEMRGIWDFLAGRYGKGHAVQYGKPAHAKSIEFTYERTVIDTPALARTKNASA